VIAQNAGQVNIAADVEQQVNAQNKKKRKRAQARKISRPLARLGSKN